MSGQEYVSPIAAAINARLRKVYEFDISGFFHLDGAAIPKIGVRVPNKGEQDGAILRAHADITKFTKDAETARNDEDIVRDRKLVHIIQKAFLDPAPKPDPADPTNPKKAFYYPAFESPQWIVDNLTTEQIGTLINLLNAVRAKESSEPEVLDDTTVDTFHNMAVGPASSEVVGEFLAGCGREFVIQLYVVEAIRLHAARAEAGVLMAEIEALKAKLATMAQPEVSSEGFVQGGHQSGDEADESS